MSAENFFSLKDRVAIVTGGSRGIGASISKRLAKAGASVVINYRSSSAKAEELLDQIKEFSPSSEIMAFDVGSKDEVDSAVSQIQEKHGRLDIVVANAGVASDALFPRSSNEHFEEVFRTNVFGVINLFRAASRGMMKSRFGRMISISSIIGENGNKGQSAYATSKSALFGLVKSVARELASRNVTCNIIAPGFIDTEMVSGLADEVKEAYLKEIPLARMGTADEIASAVHFLASEEAAYITGATLDLNGGLLMR